MTATDEAKGPAWGMHRVRIIPPDTPGPAPALAYGIEIDGHRLCPDRLEITFDNRCFPIVTLSLPAIVENTEILAVLETERRETEGPHSSPEPEDDGEGDEPLLGCREDC